ncbi:Zn-dependent metalloprotease [Pelomyxa schiedti]|nr:Zn-dependent metalloprotease [Pelomyxa schiedti]
MPSATCVSLIVVVVVCVLSRLAAGYLENSAAFPQAIVGLWPASSPQARNSEANQQVFAVDFRDAPLQSRSASFVSGGNGIENITSLRALWRRDNMDTLLKHFFPGVAADDLVLRDTSPCYMFLGEQVCVYTQFYQGYPTMGHQLKVSFDSEERITRASGTIISKRSRLPSVPSDSYNKALNTCLAIGHLCPNMASVTGANIVVYSFDSDPMILAWKILCRRHYFYVDSASSNLISVHPQHRHAEERFLWVGDTLVWKEGDPDSGDQDIEDYLNATSAFYTTFENMIGWLSFDGKDSPLIAHIHYQDTFEQICPNAAYNGVNNEFLFCSGMTFWDVSLHEEGHAFTHFTDDTGIYEDPSAINESWSDINEEALAIMWNMPWTLGMRSSNRSCVSDSTHQRWITWLAVVSGSRDLYNPNCTYNTAAAKDCLCSFVDASESHANSGVVGIVFAITCDGGELNGEYFPGIGILKTWWIFLTSKMSHQTADTRFYQLADFLALACHGLIGKKLVDHLGYETEESITSDDCDTLVRLTDTLGLRETPCTSYQYLLAFPRYLPLTGGKFNVETSSTQCGATQYLSIHIGSETWVFSGTPIATSTYTPSWSYLTQFTLPGLSIFDSNRVISYNLSCDASFTITPTDSLNSQGKTVTRKIVFYDPPFLTGLSPVSGVENDIVVVTGDKFQQFSGPCAGLVFYYYSCLSCKFGSTITGAVFIDNSTILCQVPAGEGEVSFEVSLNAQDFTDSGLTFTYSSPAHTLQATSFLLTAITIALLITM